MTEYVVIADTEEPTAPPSEGDEVELPPFYLYDVMFPVEVAKSKAKPPKDVDPDQWEPITWEWVVPNFSVDEVAKTFFGLSAHWLRWRGHPSRSNRYPQGYFILDGRPLEEKRTPHNSRYFTLPDVERLVHALVQNGALDGERAVVIINAVRAVAAVHGVTT